MGGTLTVLEQKVTQPSSSFRKTALRRGEVGQEVRRWWAWGPRRSQRGRHGCQVGQGALRTSTEGDHV